ncbi:MULTISPECIES: ferredoxin--NADP reductase [unclassified Mycobacterium]|uniref:ferredoxin--NADP reductase n=1 Tax=unclassified Mycobacterium TaxID=2642494 RepID=UPI000740237E|nr:MULTISPECIES: ferredoxin--NADP reductase [unclassified Mycobacterium]KUH80222.1 ferredoxin [Mycobacterium sp. GA-0227b]KUH81774.1 ferredoxin [Mycobacterium sp. GA-1999]KUH94054.1 ferredoxin [Mycobacterium sp. IS-1556]
MSEQAVEFAPLRIKRVVRETSDAVSLVLDVPADCSQRFRYRAGQFLTLRVKVAGDDHRRCYSMSSSPHNGEDLQITVKRDPGGLVSNYLNDTASAGDEIHAAPPEGRFVLGEAERDIVAFAGGSGITPIFSLIGFALVSTDRRVKLFYANRSRDSVIFGESLSALADDNSDRLAVTHHFDEESGVVQRAAVEAFVDSGRDVEYYICGPGPFMDTVEATLLEAGVPRDRLHLERFEVAPPPVDVVEATEQTEEVVIELDRKTVTAPYRAGNTLLQTARIAGLRAPSSCETGSCGTCMARIESGSARMLNNDALDDDEVAEGWVLTCQSLPTSRTVHVIYE